MKQKTLNKIIGKPAVKKSGECCGVNPVIKNILFGSEESDSDLMLRLLWDDILEVPVFDPTSVSDWNAFFDLPTNGTPFTSVAIVGNEVQLSGVNGITLAASLFSANDHIISVIDDALCIVAVGNDCFLNAINFTTAELNVCTNIILHDNFRGAASLIALSIPSCATLGDTVGDNGVFLGIAGNNITLTVPAALMTCDAGSPDGDIVALQAANTVTIITV